MMTNLPLFKRTAGGFISLLITVITCGLIAAMPITANAQNAPITINVTSLTTTTIGNLANGTVSEYEYNSSTKVLTLYTPNGDYKLSGTNTDLQVRVDNLATDATVTLTHIAGQFSF